VGYRVGEKRFYPRAALESAFTPGLELTIQKVAINGTSVAVTFQITDDAGQGLDQAGIQTAGPVSTSFVLSRIRPGDTQYSHPQVSFTITNNAGNPVALSALSSLELTISGPTSEYSVFLPWQESALAAPEEGREEAMPAVIERVHSYMPGVGAHSQALPGLETSSASGSA
jgi:hypothetical protein